MILYILSLFSYMINTTLTFPGRLTYLDVNTNKYSTRVSMLGCK